MKIEEIVLSKTLPQQTEKNCFKSAYFYNCQSHCAKNYYLHSKPACNGHVCPKQKEIKEVCKQANLIALTTQFADNHAHLDTVKITCELES